jgi:hypothetical protein
MGREANKNENQGDILIIMSFAVNLFFLIFKSYLFL